MPTTREIQTKLAELGFSPGEIDGVSGKRTRDAVREFQRASGLQIDGVAGPQTLRALGFTADATTIPPWMTDAKRYLGMVEGTKRANTLLKMDTAEIPWCGGFAALIMSPLFPIPENPLWARNWMKFGVSISSPQYGAVAVFQRPTGGHVGFVAGHDRENLHILGGNQSNRVSIAKVAKSRLLGYRWPANYPLNMNELPFTTLAGTVSTNEA